jgi:hypothetical protein
VKRVVGWAALAVGTITALYVASTATVAVPLVIAYIGLRRLAR